MQNKVKIIGTGSYVPENVVTNEEIVKVIQEKSPAWIVERLGIKERRFVRKLDPVTGKPFNDGNQVGDTDIGEKASRIALADAGISASDIGMIIVVTCTPDFPHFSYPAIELHRRLGVKDEVNAVHIDSGCGGAMQAIGMAYELLEYGKERDILIVASNCSSPMINSDAYNEAGAWLANYLFGDGAGAFVLSNRKTTVGHVIQSVAFGTNGERPLVTHPGGGCLMPGHSAPRKEFSYIVDGKGVKELFAPFMQKTIAALQKHKAFKLEDIDRFFLHQANYHLLQGFAGILNLPKEKVAVNVDKYGNTSAAATVILFDEDRKNHVIKPGQTVLFAAIGAGVHFGGMLLEI